MFFGSAVMLLGHAWTMGPRVLCVGFMCLFRTAAQECDSATAVGADGVHGKGGSSAERGPGLRRRPDWA